MGELARLTTEQQQPTDTDDRGTPAETGLMLVEQEKTFEKSDSDALREKASELRGISEVQRGLEESIIGAGLQTMADRYGADRLLDAMQNEATFQEIISKLAPEKSERDALYEAIKSEPMDTLAERFDGTLGGVANGNPGVGQMEQFRRHEVVQIQGKMTSGDTIIPRYRNKEGRTDSANLLLTGNLDDLLEKHPNLAEGFRETNDTLGLLKGIRDIYETEYAQFSTDLEQAKATIEEKIAKEEVGITELQTLADDIYADEIATLEERLAGASSDAAKEMVQGMLDKKTAEVMATREDFKNKLEAVRSKIIADLGAEELYLLSVSKPVETQPTYDDKEWHAA